jgi:hypothetical protein
VPFNKKSRSPDCMAVIPSTCISLVNDHATLFVCRLSQPLLLTIQDPECSLEAMTIQCVCMTSRA